MREGNPEWRWRSKGCICGTDRWCCGAAAPSCGNLAVLVGAGVNVAIGTNGRDADVGFGLPESVQRSGQTTVRIYPGLLLGLQI